MRLLLFRVGFVFLILLSGTPLSAASDDGVIFDENIGTPPSASASLSSAYSDQKSVTFTGRLDFLTIYSLSQSYLNSHQNWNKNRLNTLTKGDFFLDVRLQKGVKAFGDIGITQLAQPASSSLPISTLVEFKELFVDFNLNHSIYVRSGKQFSNWGRSFFWNPVDFVNRDTKNFNNLNAIRSGVTGTRLHVPGGSGQDFYLFLDLNDVHNLDQIALIPKWNFLLGNAEFGLSALIKNKSECRYGFDFSTAFWGWNVASEVALSHGNDRQVLQENAQVLSFGSIRDRWVPLVTLDFSKTLNWERADRIRVNWEGFYNGAGYRENVLSDPKKRVFLLTNNGIAHHYFSRTYHAMFVTISEFPNHDTSLDLNALQNLVDGSGVLSLGLTYQVVDGLTLRGAFSAYFGSGDSEYRVEDQAFDLIGQATLTF